MEIVRRFASRVTAADLPGLVERSVFGIDIDATACNRARAAVVGMIEELCGPQRDGYFIANVRCADFLDLDPEIEHGIDFLVGNPPYVSAVNLDSAAKARYLSRFETAWGRLDLYALFIEHGLRFLRRGGRLSYVTPDKWLTAESSSRLRSFVSREFTIRTIDRFDRHDLFPGVATVPCVTVIEHAGESAHHVGCRWWDVLDGTPTVLPDTAKLAITDDGGGWTPVATSTATASPTVPLGDLVLRISAGLATGLNRCFVVGAEQAAQIEPELLRPIARGRDIDVGSVADAGLWILVPYVFEEGGGSPRLIDLTDYPGALAHLQPHRAALEQRHCVRVWKKPWHALHDPVTLDLARRPKILVPDVAREPRFALDRGNVLPLHSAYYLLLPEDGAIDGQRLTAFLNSPAVAADLRTRAATAKSGYRRFRSAVLRDLPVPRNAT
ncbi:MAG: hypothetical protein QOK34_1214 [Gaiellaceae bacterium]|nr:hypothetical protein [Gaiellaceae bacterium]